MSYDEYADEAAYQEQMAAYANEVEAQLEDEYRADQAEQLASMTEEERAVWLQRVKRSDPTAPPDEPYDQASKGLFQMRRDTFDVPPADFDEKAAAFDKLMTEYGMSTKPFDEIADAVKSKWTPEVKKFYESLVVGERVRYIGTEFDATHGGQVGTVMQADGLAGLKWVQFDDDTIAPQGWFPAKDLESYVPTEIVNDPDMPVGGGVFYHEEVFEQFAKLGGQGPYRLGKEMTEKMFGGPVEPGPEEVEAPSCIGCGRSMFSAVYHSRPVWWCSECNERRPRSLDGMSTVEEHKDSTDRVLEGFDAEVKRAAKITDVELILLRWRYGSDEQRREGARKVATEIVRRLS